jgi:hypothetical protein
MEDPLIKPITRYLFFIPASKVLAKLGEMQRLLEKVYTLYFKSMAYVCIEKGFSKK